MVDGLEFVVAVVVVAGFAFVAEDGAYSLAGDGANSFVVVVDAAAAAADGDVGSLTAAVAIETVVLGLNVVDSLTAYFDAVVVSVD